MEEEQQLVFSRKHWTYAPSLIPNPNEMFEALRPQIAALAKTYMIEMYGKKFESRKVSCLFAGSVEEVHARADAQSKGFDSSADDPQQRGRVI